MTELPQFVEVFVWSNNLQNIQQSVGERERERERVGEGGREGEMSYYLKSQHTVSLMGQTAIQTHMHKKNTVVAFKIQLVHKTTIVLHILRQQSEDLLHRNRKITCIIFAYFFISMGQDSV